MDRLVKAGGLDAPGAQVVVLSVLPQHQGRLQRPQRDPGGLSGAQRSLHGLGTGESHVVYWAPATKQKLSSNYLVKIYFELHCTNN